MDFYPARTSNNEVVDSRKKGMKGWRNVFCTNSKIINAPKSLKLRISYEKGKNDWNEIIF